MTLWYKRFFKQPKAFIRAMTPLAEPMSIAFTGNKRATRLLDRFAWHLTRRPSLERMNQASALLLGEHDFRAFGRALKEDATTVRRIYQAEWQLTDWGAAFTIKGNAFLYHMVRRLVYLLVEVGLERLPIEVIERGLEIGTTGIVALAPARGLTCRKLLSRR